MSFDIKPASYEQVVIQLSFGIPQLLRNLVRKLFNRSPAPSRARAISNQWLRAQLADISGDVLAIGAGDDSDGEGHRYKHYFQSASSYTTSEISDNFGTDLVLDVRRMPELRDGSYACVFCSGVLEHVDDFQAALREIGRILSPDGILLLGLPFRQALHLAPHDYWRFTEYGIRYLLRDNYEIIDIWPVDEEKTGFPSAYWTKARKTA